MIKEAIIDITNKQDLSLETAKAVMSEIMGQQATDVQIAAYLVALSMKGETIDEITASAQVMRQFATNIQYSGDILDIVGTGGDKSNSFNISTTCAIVLAAAGVKIGKHGNRAASSQCGSADVLEALGVNLTVTPEQSVKMLEEIGICFLFAPVYHSSMKYVAPVRKELSVKSIFNILGPLSNPLFANMQLMGVYSETLIQPLAKVLSNLGVKQGIVVHGTDGLDEISLSATTKVCEFRDGNFKNYEIDPTLLGFTLCNKDDLKGGTPAENAKITTDILNGVPGAKRDAVVLNSAVALYISRNDITLEQAITIIEDVLDSKKALEKLEQFVKMSNS